MIVYLNNEFLQLEEAKISPFDRGFLFADGVYESIRTYNGKLFYYKDHLKRLRKSLNEIRLLYNETEKIERIIYELINTNNINGEALIYLQITRGTSVPRTHSFTQEDVNPTIFISAAPLKRNEQEQKEGIRVSLQDDIRWLRCDIKSISLLPVIIANQSAVDAGGKEAILRRNGLITEGSHTNFFAIKDKIALTAPAGPLILSGITRMIVLELFNQLEIKVKEEFIKADELKMFNEFFITSTIKEITPVVQIDEWIVGDGKPGELTHKAQNAFDELVENY
ncbi:MAG: D-amino-acid transaminase [Ignavibacterium sp.]|nr:MAG: D-amino-acid transaminase [Ignavibacterium sp.]